MKEKAFKARFIGVVKDKYGKKTILYDDSIRRTPYGIWMQIDKVESGDLIIKHSGTHNHLLIKTGRSDTIVLEAVSGLNCNE